MQQRCGDSDIIANHKSNKRSNNVVTVRAFVTVNLLIEHFELSVYYYYYYYKNSAAIILSLFSQKQCTPV